MNATMPAKTLVEARRQREGGRPGEALRLLVPLVDETPDDPEAWALMAAAALDLGSFVEAGRAFARTLDLDPEHRDALLGAGLVKQAQGRHTEARDGWQRAAEILAEDPVPPSLLGVSHMREGDMGPAESWFREALRRRPGHADALAGLGSILERTGRAAEGAELLRVATAGCHPHGAVAAIMARCLLETGQPDAALDVVQRALKGQPNRNRQVQLEHVCGEILDRLGRRDEAFEAFARANGLRAARFEGAQHLGAVRQIIRMFTPETLAALPRGTDERRRSVLVVGVPRSGTSLVERMLSRHPAVAGAGELDTWRLLVVELARRWGLSADDVWYNHLNRLSTPLLDELAAGYHAELDRHAGASQQLIVDKMPHNVFQLPLASLALPGTVVVHVLRDPLDTGWSCYRQNFTDGLAWSTSQEGIALYLRAERELMAHWKKTLDVPVITMRYEDLTAAPRTALEPVLAAGGLAWDESILRFHERDDYLATASYRDVRRPVYRSSVGRSQDYAAHLAPMQRLLAALGPLPE